MCGCRRERVRARPGASSRDLVAGEVHRVHIGRALKREGKAWIVDQDVVMLYRRGANDVDNATGNLVEDGAVPR